MYVYVYIYIYTHIPLSLYICVYIYIYTHTYIYTHVMMIMLVMLMIVSSYNAMYVRHMTVYRKITSGASLLGFLHVGTKPAPADPLPNRA